MQYFTVDCNYSYNLLNSFLKGAILVNEDFKVKLYSHLRIFIVLRKYFSVSAALHITWINVNQVTELVKLN